MRYTCKCSKRLRRYLLHVSQHISYTYGKVPICINPSRFVVRLPLSSVSAGRQLLILSHLQGIFRPLFSYCLGCLFFGSIEPCSGPFVPFQLVFHRPSGVQPSLLLYYIDAAYLFGHVAAGARC